MAFNISPGIIITMLGLGGLVFTLVDSAGEIGSKIPLAVFFLAIIIIGIAIEVAPKEQVDGVYGEVGSPQDFG